MDHWVLFQMKSFARIIRWASLLFREMLYVEVSLSLSGISNQLCAVLPPVIKSAAIPDNATATAISPNDLTVDSKTLYKKVFPVPPGSSIKKHPSAHATACITASYTLR